MLYKPGSCVSLNWKQSFSILRIKRVRISIQTFVWILLNDNICYFISILLKNIKDYKWEEWRKNDLKRNILIWGKFTTTQNHQYMFLGSCVSDMVSSVWIYWSPCKIGISRLEFKYDSNIGNAVVHITSNKCRDKGN